MNHQRRAEHCLSAAFGVFAPTSARSQSVCVANSHPLPYNFARGVARFGQEGVVMTKISVLVAAILVLGGVGALFALSQTDGASQSMTVADVVKSDGETRARMKLVVTQLDSKFKPISFLGVQMPSQEVQEDRKAFKEYIDQAPKIRVRYDGDDQLAIELHSHVTLDGKWHAESQVMVADTMQTKCPTRYSEDSALPKPEESNPLLSNQQ